MRGPLRIFLCVFVASLFLASAQTTLPSNKTSCGKVDIIETPLPTSGNVQMFFVSEDNKSVFVLNSRTHELFHSRDEGRTWYHVTQINNFPVYQLFHMEMKTDAQSSYHVVYFLAGSFDNTNGNTMWVYRSDIDTYEKKSSLTGFTQLFIAPFGPSTYVLALRHFKGDSNNDVAAFYFTKDGGDSWNKVMDAPVRSLTHSSAHAQWSLFTKDHPQRIYLDRLIDPVLGGAEIVYSDNLFETFHPLKISDTSDQFVNWWTIARNMNRDAESDRMVVLTCRDSFCRRRQLHVSNDGATTFETAKFYEKGGEASEEASFNLMDVWDDSNYWVGIPRDCFPDHSRPCWEFFRSAETPVEFESQITEASDFTKYQGAKGVFVANTYKKVDGKVISPNLVNSVISFNRGASWEFIKAPFQDSEAQPTNCALSSGCSLHIHGPMSDANVNYAWFYSVPNAPGVMVANGNAGSNLNGVFSNSNVYVSVDGGKNFREIRKGPHIPEIGDHGAIIVLVKEDRISDTLTYTIDDESWVDCKFTNEPLLMTNVRVSTGWDSRNFIGHGKRGDSVVLFHINFEKELSRKCSVAHGDFTNWAVPGSQDDGCTMGEKILIKRRKPNLNSPCYIEENEPNYGFEVSSSLCPCSLLDYECAPCFARQEVNGPCVLNCPLESIAAPGNQIIQDMCNADPSAQIQVPLGTRVMAQSKCTVTNGVEQPKGVVHCADLAEGGKLSNKAPSGSGVTAAIVIVIVVIVVVLIAGGVWYLWNFNHEFRTHVSYVLNIDDSTEVVAHYDPVDQPAPVDLDVDSDDDSF